FRHRRERARRGHEVRREPARREHRTESGVGARRTMIPVSRSGRICGASRSTTKEGAWTLLDGLAIPESPRWHDDRLWFSNWGTGEAHGTGAWSRPSCASTPTTPSPSTFETWPDVPTRYLLCRDDRMFPAAWARRHARKRLDLEADEIDGGHYITLSRPREL